MPKRYTYELPDHKVEYGVEVNVNDLRIDDRAQRTLNERRAKTMAEGLIREALGSIVVSRRTDDELYVVDGMHRKTACQLAGVETIVAEIHHGLDQQQEAVLFLLKNREANKPNALDEYKVGITAGVQLFVDTAEVLKRHNLELGATSTNSIGAVSGVLKITEEYGPKILSRTLDVAEQAWGRTRESWDGMLLAGIGMFLGRHGSAVDDEELAVKLAKESHAAGWRGRVLSVSSAGGTRNSGTGSRVHTCYELVLQAWNKGRMKKNRVGEQ
jgi:hypothetical protein